MTAIAVQDGDIYIDAAGNLALVTGIYRVLQQCEQVMKLFLAEAIYAQERGIPYMQTVFDRRQLDQFESYARDMIVSVPGVVEVLTFEYRVSGDVLFYDATILTEFGEGRISG